MRDKRTPSDVCGEAIFCPFRSSPLLEIQSTPLGLNPLVPQFCIHLSKRPSYYLWYLILYQRFYMVDIERFSDRYREKQTDEGLDWQPGNISVLLIYCIIYLSDLKRCCSTEHVLETNPSVRKKNLSSYHTKSEIFLHLQTKCK